MDTVAGEAEIVDTLGDTTPGMNATLAVPTKVMLLVVSVADMVLVSALVDLILAVTLPLASVGAAG